ncbi:unnamed protein product [Bursaphelenchus okinawaensis]|uniref:BACK domain-containing protein n=1 Tax=Bursaphelenchus okinawaensis TaxID=465554 RepID=A0A811LM91_9BILA|nr:unnamed protein product [Bursaphelenchus okinawaensis]CAG9124251.1 unnamed protein product [Bursaphelenchus okinawaensis]
MAQPSPAVTRLCYSVLEPESADPSADLCFHCLDGTNVYAHSFVVNDIWPQLMAKSGMAESCEPEELEIWGEVPRTHHTVFLERDVLHYLLELAYGRLDTNFLQNEFFYNKLKLAIKQYPIDESLYIIFKGKTFKKFHLDQLLSDVGIDDILFKYMAIAQQDPDKAEELVSEVVYHLYKLVKTSASANQQFFHLETEHLKRLLSDNNLNIHSEAQVLELILLYINHNAKTEEQRRRMATQLVPCIRYGGHTFGISLNNAITSNELTIKNYQEWISPDTVTSRLPRDVLVIYGGWLDRPSRMCQVLARHEQRFTQMEWFADKCPLAYHVLIELNKTVYLIGGYNNQEYLKNVRKLNDGDTQWQSCPSMFAPRCYASACSDDQRFIYVCGGYNGRRRLRTVEKFDTWDQKWYKLPSMHHHRSDAAAAYFKGQLIVAGGFNGENVMPFVEIYCEETRQWQEVWNMNTPRSGLSLVPFDNKLYAIGGYTAGEITGTVEVLADCHGAWSEFTSLRQKRSNFSAIQYDGCLFVMGGHDGSTTTNTVEILYSGQTQFVPGPNLVVKCSAFRTAVLRDWKSTKFDGDKLVSKCMTSYVEVDLPIPAPRRLLSDDAIDTDEE